MTAALLRPADPGNAPQPAMTMADPSSSLQLLTWSMRNGEPGLIFLRNAGTKPLRLHGDLLAEGSSRQDDAMLWHEIAIYRTDGPELAVALRLVGTDTPQNNLHRARLFPTMDAAATWLEQFDPQADVAVDFDVSDKTLTATCVALKAVALRERAERLERAYRSLVGELLFQMASEF